MVFRPGEKAKYEAPGEEEMSGNAQELFTQAQEAEKEWRQQTRDQSLPHARSASSQRYARGRRGFSDGAIAGTKHDYLKAAQTYAVVAEKFPKSDHFNEAIEAQFRIGEMYLAGRKTKIFGISVKASMDHCSRHFLGHRAQCAVTGKN